ncbi:MAG: CorA family divalent cation transporter [Verrucomicrobium sp.]|nr:CorA family divalent cation transporter [Verrucomicrobium sp.]
MIKTVFVRGGQVDVREGLAPDDQAASTVWIHAVTPSKEELESLRHAYGLDVTHPIEGIREDADIIHIPARLLTVAEGARPVLRRVRFLLGERIVATLDEGPGSAAFDKALQRLQHKPSLGENPRALFRLILQALNESGEQLIDKISAGLTHDSAAITALSGTLQRHGKEVGVADLTDLIMRLNAKEELVSQCLERQLFLARAARRLEGAIDDEREPVLARLASELISDIEGVQQHAAHEHNRVYYLQEALNASLNVKQNQIVKIFTILSAIFMPPTLIASIYGMNWVHMPELGWNGGFLYSILFMFVSAVLPLVYIKRRGWLR